MTIVADLTEWLEQFAPARLAEPWDNVGLLWGDPQRPVQKVMTCLTVAPSTAAEAIDTGADLIVSHHPVLFRAVKQIRADLPETGFLWELARAGVAIASPHTAFDNTNDGINDLLCERLGLLDVSGLRAAVAAAAPGSFKIVVFTPEAEREAVSSAAFQAGAGRIGAYEECSFAIPGEGTFFGTDLANPAIGERGRRETVSELRLEFVCPSGRLAAVIAAVREVILMKSLRSTSTHCTRSTKGPVRRRARAHRPVGQPAAACGIRTCRRTGARHRFGRHSW